MTDVAIYLRAPTIDLPATYHKLRIDQTTGTRAFTRVSLDKK